MRNKTSFTQVLSFFVFVLMVILYVIAFNNYEILSGLLKNLQAISILGLIVYLFILLSWRKVYHRFLSPYIVFTTLLFLCVCGQCILWAFNLPAGFRDLKTWCNLFTEIELCNGLLFSYVCLLFLHFVVIGSINPKTKRTYEKIKKSNKLTFNIIETEEAYKRITTFGIILCIVFILPYLISFVNQYKIIKTLGYDAQYDFITYGVSSIFSKVADFYPVGVITLIFSWGKKNDYNKFNYNLKKSVIFLLTGLYLGCELLLGQRTGIILFVVALLFIKYKDEKIPFKNIIVIGVVAILLMCCLRIVGVTRSGDTFSLADSENNPAIDFLSDTGWNLMSLVEFQKLIPDVKNYSYGISYLVSFLAIIPNLNFWPMHPAYVYGNISNWLREQLGFSFGLGCTPIAEAYYNFGFFGFLVFIFWGIFIISLNRKFEDSSKLINNYYVVLFMGILLKSCVRGSFYAVFRPLILFVVLPTIIVSLLSKKKIVRKGMI